MATYLDVLETNDFEDWQPDCEGMSVTNWGILNVNQKWNKNSATVIIDSPRVF